jgi:hypothetical protein
MTGRDFFWNDGCSTMDLLTLTQSELTDSAIFMAVVG